MIIYGIKSAHLKSRFARTVTCESCKTPGVIWLRVFRKHVHLFWIPIFPIGKTGVGQCQHCKRAYEVKEMPEALKREYDNLKLQAKGPIWQFVGLFLISAIISWSLIVSEKTSEKQLAYISNPQEGDIYSYKIETGSYSTLKIVKVTADSVYVVPNKFISGKVIHIYKIDKEENYSDEYYGISKYQLKEMFNAKDIFSIKRKEIES